MGTFPGTTLVANTGYYMRTSGANIYRATSSVTLPAFSCYLPSDEKRTYFNLVEDATGIQPSSVSREGGERTKAVYDLSGRRVSKAQRGIYIQEGKKVVVK